MPTSPTDLSGVRQQVKTSDFFALCYLMLCELSYTAEANGQTAVELITKWLPNMPAPKEGTVPGKWGLGWGPQVTNGNGNLMYSAEFLDSQTGTPVFSAVVIRGTDVESKPSGILAQIMEDLCAEKQVTFPEGNTEGAKIAQGAKDGLDALTGLRHPDSANGKTITEYVQDFATKNTGAPIVVTGHSLGGCQTTVLALHLSAALAGHNPPLTATIVPNTFAAPTAGNPAFAHLYQQTFPYSPRWFNTRDLVPNAYASVDGIKDLWTACKRPAPLMVKMAVEGLKLLLQAAGANYMQPQRDDRKLTSECQPEGVSAIPAYVQSQAAREIEALLQRAIARSRQAGKLPEIVKNLEEDFRQPGFAGTAHLRIALLELIRRFADEALALIEKFSFATLFEWIEELLYQHLILSGYWEGVKSGQGDAAIDIPKEFLEARAARAGQ